MVAGLIIYWSGWEALGYIGEVDTRIGSAEETAPESAGVTAATSAPVWPGVR